MKMQIQKGDNVKIISGKHKGEYGKVFSVIKNKHQVIIENINIKTKHIKPKQTEDRGHIKKIERPIHYSNVKLINKTR
uniref:ribosomal protein L24 n=1 Tax=Echinothamnion hookeri TaxID=2008680 RepID=UPI002551EC74|nr:ribosomal protein L24 [Echinothamnion hookeri]WGH14444.1 ribosomal protein L24 [Echinothamnion hookeri]